MTMPFISIDWTLVIQLCNTLILFLVLKKILFKPVMAMIESRKTEVADTYAAAEKERAEAARLKEEYIQSISGAKEEAASIVQDAHKRAQSRSDEIVSEAQKKAQDLMHRTEEEIARDKKRAINEAKNEISDLALLIAEKVVEKDIHAEDHEKLIETFIDGVGDVAWKA